jgi:hypothetical protein
LTSESSALCSARVEAPQSPPFRGARPDTCALSKPPSSSLQDYRNLVEHKLHTFGELYDSMVDRYNETRSFVLEVLVAILAVLDVIFLFRGR